MAVPTPVPMRIGRGDYIKAAKAWGDVLGIDPRLVVFPVVMDYDEIILNLVPVPEALGEGRPPATLASKVGLRSPQDGDRAPELTILARIEVVG